MEKSIQLSLAQALEKNTSGNAVEKIKLIEPDKLIGLKVNFKTVRRSANGGQPRTETVQGIVVQPARVPGYVIVRGIEGGEFNRAISDLEVRP